MGVEVVYSNDPLLQILTSVAVPQGITSDSEVLVIPDYPASVEVDDSSEEVLTIDDRQVVREVLTTEESLSLPAYSSLPINIENYSGPAGPKGDKGDVGEPGPMGPAPNINSINITTTSPNDDASGSVSGTNPDYYLDIVIPRGSRILNGTEDPLSATGEEGDWYLNNNTWDIFEKTSVNVWTMRGTLKGPVGDKGSTGDTGPANSLTVGTVEASISGSNPQVTIAGTPPNQTISFVLPRGDQGEAGPPPSLIVGTVTTGEPETSASATINGSAGNYALNLTIPRGATGNVGSQWYQGATPTVETGTNGDFFLITSGDNIGDTYKKVNDEWTLVGNIRGAAGTGTVSSVNSVNPDASGNVALSYGDITGTIPSNALPSLAVTDVFPVASQAAMLSLNAQRGDIAIRSDISETFILSTDSPSTLADWKVMSSAGKVTSVNGQSGTVLLTKSDVDLGNVDNTSDLSKPVSTATQSALNAKEDAIVSGTTTQYYRGDKTWQALNPSAVGLGNVSNVAQVDTINNQTVGGIKTFTIAPVVPDNSWAISKTNGLQGALDSKANVSHTHDAGAIISGVIDIARLPTGTTATTVALGNHLHTGVYEPIISAGATGQYYRGDKQWATLNSAAVGLGSVDNTSDSAKPISTAQQSALDLKADLDSPTFTGIVGGITATMVGLGNVPNVDARARSTHTGTQSADTIVDGTTNKAYTAADDTKLAGIAAGATVNSTDASLRARSTHTGTQDVSTITGLTKTSVGLSAVPNIDATNASNLSSGTVPEARLLNRISDYHANDVPGGNWNGATASGWYAHSGAANAPGGGWWRGYVVAHNSVWVTQDLISMANGTEGLRYTRYCNGGTWSAWEYVPTTQARLNSLYSQVGHTHRSWDVSKFYTNIAINGGSNYTVTTTSAAIASWSTSLAVPGQKFLVNVAWDIEATTGSSTSTIGSVSVSGGTVSGGLMIFKSPTTAFRQTLSGTWVVEATSSNLSMSNYVYKELTAGAMLIRGGNSSMIITEI